MTLARRLWLASAMLAALVGAAFVALILAVSAQRDAAEREERSKDLATTSLQLERLVSEAEAGFLTWTAARDDLYLDPYRRARRELPGRLRSLRVLAGGDASQRRRARALELRVGDYLSFVDALIPQVAVEPGLVADATVVQANRGYTDDIRRLFARFRQTEDALAAEAAADAESRTTTAIVVGSAAVGVSTALIALFGIVLARSIGRPLSSVAESAEHVAAGDLSVRLPLGGPGEVGELRRSFNLMAERLEVQRAELQRQNAELRESERMKTELIDIVSHELRTPLASVLGFTALLLKRDFDAATRRHYLGIVNTQARRLAALLEDFLDVQRIEHGGVELAAENVDLGNLLTEQANLYSGQSPLHRVEVELEEPELTVRGDPNRLAQVVGNLLSNAIKYSPQGGRVAVRAQQRAGGVRVAVSDEGLGIPREQQSRIFTKFFRGDAGATGITGTGLGLAVSREIVEAHGGRIGFESDPGEGTTFWLELPGSNGEAATTDEEERA